MSKLMNRLVIEYEKQKTTPIKQTMMIGSINYVNVYRDYVFQVVFYDMPMIPHYCGYVVINDDDIIPRDNDPEGDFDYDAYGIECHGGLTFGRVINGQNVIGFDCAHFDDTPEVQNLAFCVQECKSIIDQLCGQH